MDTREVPTDVLAPASMPLERIEAEITELAGHMAAAESRWLQLVAEFDDRFGYEQWGCRTCAHWLSWHCALDQRSAREKLRVAHALRGLALISAEFAAGRLSYSKVRALTRIANPENEAALVGLARHATAAQVERSVRAYRGVLSREEEIDRANRNHEERYFRGDWDDDGALVLNGRLTADVGAADDTGGVCEVDGGPAIAPETARRLACDGSVVWMLHDDTGRVINVSPKAPAIPPALRRAVHARDQGCDFPGCGECSFTDVHHIRHREHGGLNELSNLVELCWHHHRLVHEGGWTVFRSESGVITAVDPAGEILGSPSTPGGAAGGVAASNRARDLVVTPTSVVSQWLGDPLHVNDVIAALWSIDRRRHGSRN